MREHIVGDVKIEFRFPQPVVVDNPGNFPLPKIRLYAGYLTIKVDGVRVTGTEGYYIDREGAMTTPFNGTREISLRMVAA
jgi:hypothetical protein